MKTQTILFLLLIATLGVQNLNAQSLRGNLEKNVENITEQINTLSKEKITELDQVALKIYETTLNKDNGGVVFIDKLNTQTSQLAMIWLNTALMYYDINIKAYSAGIEANKNIPITHLSSLKKAGFTVKPANMRNPNNYWIGYNRSGSWLVFTKTLLEINTSPENTVNIIVDDTEVDEYRTSIKLTFSNDSDLPLHMVHLATQINYLIKNKI